MIDAFESSPAMRALSEFRRELSAMAPNEVDLVTVERRAHELTNAIGAELVKAAMERADAPEPEVTIHGEVWGNRRAAKGTYYSVFGPVEPERGVFQRSGRGRVAVPMELRTGIVEGAYTPRLARIMSRAVALMTAEEAEGFLGEVGVAKMSVSTLHRVPRAMAARYEAHRVEIEPAVRQADPIPVGTVTIQVALDGVMVPQDGEHARPRGRKTDSPDPPRHEQRYGESPVVATADHDSSLGRAWHEAGVGTIAFYDAEGERLKTTYLGEMPVAEKAVLVRRLTEEALSVVAEQPAVNICFASDGAIPQWNALEAIHAALPKSFVGEVMYLLDLFHVAEHLQKAANAIYGTATFEQKADTRTAAEHWKTTLESYDDGPRRVLKALRYQRDKLMGARRKDVNQVIKYVALHSAAGRMAYAEAARRHYPRGTGVTEAAAKTLVGVRMKRAGARYSQHGGQTILLFRSAVLSNRFHILSRHLEATYVAKVLTKRAA
jgi:hypothetical protein